jgi:ribosomal protein L37E
VNKEVIMALIKCPECGKEISDQSKVCIHCGYPLDTNQVSEANGTSSDVEKNNNLQNKKIALAAIGGLILVGIVVIVLVNANNPLKRAQKYYKEGNLEAFTENKIEMSSEEANTFTQQLIGDVDRVNEDYVSGKISYEEAVEQLEKILSYGDTSSISNYNTVKYDID